ncbi:DUF4235 domain-containing protein [Streptomyces sp. NPDC127063]|uniref:DUF4235 domain-containing protein n=1 Tax=Streptomyces sp. NPDC127063 TaxID=3347123 RepID=UPI0036476382
MSVLTNTFRLCDRQALPELGDKRCRLSVTKPAEVLLAAVVQGAIFAGVKTAVGRAGAATTRRLTGT